MFFIKGNTKKAKGFTLIEVIVSLSLMTILMSVLISNFKVHLNNYNFISNYALNSISIKETFMFIEREISKNSIAVMVENNTLFLAKNISNGGINWGMANKIMKYGGTLRYYYPGKTIGDYTSQPLLYNIESFTIEENYKVLYIKIETKDGTICEKTFYKKYE